MSILSPNSHPSFSFLIPPVFPLIFLNLEFLLEFLWLWVCICVCIRLYTTYRVHSVFLICTCVQAWHLEIGQPVWRLLPGGNWFSFLRSQFQPIALHSGAGSCGKPCPHSHVKLTIVIMLILFRQLDCWEFMYEFFPVMSRGCYLLLCILVLWLLESFCTLFNSFSWTS